MTIHVLSGLPRAGSTLLCNVLAQHPDVAVSGTSPLFNCVDAIVTALSTTAEVQAELANVPGSQERYLKAIRAFMLEFRRSDKPHQIDKSRGWLQHLTLLRQVDPKSAAIICVRDPRDVIASIERHHRATPMFHHPSGRSIEESTRLLMGPKGMVGGPIRFVEDIIKRKIPVVFVRYESFTVSPQPILQQIHEAMGVKPYKHNLTKIKNVATDLDAVYRNKFPHEGSGPLKPSKNDWHDVLSDDVGARIAASYPLYMQTFGYTESTK